MVVKDGETCRERWGDILRKMGRQLFADIYQYFQLVRKPLT